MKKLIPFVFAIAFTGAQAQVFEQAEAEARVPGAVKCRMDSQTGLPEFVKFRPDARIYTDGVEKWAAQNLKFKPGEELFLRRADQDQLGMTHYRYVQRYKGVPVIAGYFVAHSRGGEVLSLNGDYYPVTQEPVAYITEEQALETAMGHMGANKYKWQLDGADEMLQRITHNPLATYRPHAELVYALNQGKQTKDVVRLAWKFDLYSVDPLGRKEVFVDAVNGEIIFINEKLHTTDVTGLAYTKYSGVQVITTDSLSPTEFRLRESGRGDGIETYNALTTTDQASAVDFLDSNNVWNNWNPQNDEVATDAHWGAEMTYDYYIAEHNRASWDNNDAVIVSFVHWDNNLSNAFWDGAMMNFGDGGGGTSPFSSLDVLAHEFTHGVTQESAGLFYQNESGALNESFSDIFGAAVEYFVRPTQFNWIIGEDVTPQGIRAMNNPNSFGNPSDYFGSFWYTGSGDNGGVHINSGVQNYWFYLLVDGDAGTNDNNEPFNVTGIGMSDAADIAYRTLHIYLGPNSQYDDARFYSIESAIDLFGECSQQMISTMDAWHACSLGPRFGNGTLVAGFDSEETEFCNAPAIVQFYNEGQGALSWLWQFGDGSTSTQLNPVKTYSFFGTWDVTLIVYGCSSAVDTLFIPDYIVIDDSIPCRMAMPGNNGGDTVTTCNGTLMDSGGNDNYLNNNVSVITIAPPGATSVTLNFTLFDFTSNAGDYLAVYDGPSTSSPLVGLFHGTNAPGGGTWTSTGGAVTLKEATNNVNNRPGFEVDWSCVVSIDPAKGNQQLVLYPNPTTGLVFVQLPAVGKWEASVFNLLGEEVYRTLGQAAGDKAELSLGELASGIYQVRMIQNGQVYVGKVVVE